MSSGSTENNPDNKGVVRVKWLHAGRWRRFQLPEAEWTYERLYQTLGQLEPGFAHFLAYRDEDDVKYVFWTDTEMRAMLAYFRDYLRLSEVRIETHEPDGSDGFPLPLTASMEQQKQKQSANTSQNKKSGDAPKVVHPNIVCDGCDMDPLCGIRYKCMICPDFDICGECEAKGLHTHHAMARIPRPEIMKQYHDVVGKGGREIRLELFAPPPPGPSEAPPAYHQSRPEINARPFERQQQKSAEVIEQPTNNNNSGKTEEKVQAKEQKNKSEKKEENKPSTHQGSSNQSPYLNLPCWNRHQDSAWRRPYNPPPASAWGPVPFCSGASNLLNMGGLGLGLGGIGGHHHRHHHRLPFGQMKRGEAPPPPPGFQSPFTAPTVEEAMRRQKAASEDAQRAFEKLFARKQEKFQRKAERCQERAQRCTEHAQRKIQKASEKLQRKAEKVQKKVAEKETETGKDKKTSKKSSSKDAPENGGAPETSARLRAYNARLESLKSTAKDLQTAFKNFGFECDATVEDDEGVVHAAIPSAPPQPPPPPYHEESTRCLSEEFQNEILTALSSLYPTLKSLQQTTTTNNNKNDECKNEGEKDLINLSGPPSDAGRIHETNNKKAAAESASQASSSASSGGNGSTSSQSSSSTSSASSGGAATNQDHPQPDPLVGAVLDGLLVIQRAAGTALNALQGVQVGPLMEQWLNMDPNGQPPVPLAAEAQRFGEGLKSGAENLVKLIDDTSGKLVREITEIAAEQQQQNGAEGGGAITADRLVSQLVEGFGRILTTTTTGQEAGDQLQQQREEQNPAQHQPEANGKPSQSQPPVVELQQNGVVKIGEGSVLQNGQNIVEEAGQNQAANDNNGNNNANEVNGIAPAAEEEDGGSSSSSISSSSTSSTSSLDRSFSTLSIAEEHNEEEDDDDVEVLMDLGEDAESAPEMESVGTNDMAETISQTNQNDVDRNSSDVFATNKIYFCQRCLNHGEEHPRKGHKPLCKYAKCQCDKCEMIELRLQYNNKLNPRNNREARQEFNRASNGSKERDPKCSRCSAHGINQKEHTKNLCPYKDCMCYNCTLVEKRREMMAKQIELRRKQQSVRCIKAGDGSAGDNIRLVEGFSFGSTENDEEDLEGDDDVEVLMDLGDGDAENAPEISQSQQNVSLLVPAPKIPVTTSSEQGSNKKERAELLVGAGMKRKHEGAVDELVAGAGENVFPSENQGEGGENNGGGGVKGRKSPRKSNDSSSTSESSSESDFSELGVPPSNISEGAVTKSVAPEGEQENKEMESVVVSSPIAGEDEWMVVSRNNYRELCEFYERWREEIDTRQAEKQALDEYLSEARTSLLALYEIAPNNPDRKQWLDEWLSFMHKIGKPITRVPTVSNQVLDLYQLYQLVVARGGVVKVMVERLWRDLIDELNLPKTLTSASFTLRILYQKYLYDYECEKCHFTAPGDLEEAVRAHRSNNTFWIWNNLFSNLEQQPMSAEEKRRLSEAINHLSGAHLARIVEIVELREPTLNTNGEIEIDFDRMKSTTLRELDAYVRAVSAKSEEEKKWKEMAEMELNRRTLETLEMREDQLQKHQQNGGAVSSSSSSFLSSLADIGSGNKKLAEKWTLSPFERAQLEECQQSLMLSAQDQSEKFIRQFMSTLNQTSMQQTQMMNPPPQLFVPSQIPCSSQSLYPKLAAAVSENSETKKKQLLEGKEVQKQQQNNGFGSSNLIDMQQQQQISMMVPATEAAYEPIVQILHEVEKAAAVESAKEKKKVGSKKNSPAPEEIRVRDAANEQCMAGQAPVGFVAVPRLETHSRRCPFVHPNLRIQRVVDLLVEEMGFDNCNGWLTALVMKHHGNLELILEEANNDPVYRSRLNLSEYELDWR